MRAREREGEGERDRKTTGYEPLCPAQTVVAGEVGRAVSQRWGGAFGVRKPNHTVLPSDSASELLLRPKVLLTLPHTLHPTPSRVQGFNSRAWGFVFKVGGLRSRD